MADSTDPPVVPSAPRLKLTPRQEEARRLLQSQRHTLLVGGSRSGKTTLLVHEIAERALRADNSRHAILRLHANAARASIALDTLPKVFRLAFPGRPLKRHRAEGYFSLDNGSEIWIGGLGDQDQVEKILGKEYATIFLNEVSQIPYASVLVALTRLAQVVTRLDEVAMRVKKIEDQPLPLGASSVRVAEKSEDSQFAAPDALLERPGALEALAELAIRKAQSNPMRAIPGFRARKE